MPALEIPALDDALSLSAQQIADYNASGHTLLRQLISPAEVEAYRPLISGAARRYSTETRPMEERDTYGKAFLQVMNLWVQDENVKRFVMAKRFASVAAQLMGVPSVRLYHDQALFKEPGGGPTPWHQDQHYWPLATDNTITMWMPMVDVPAEVGSMNFGSGSNSLGYLGDMPISDRSEKVIADFIAQKGLQIHNYGPLKAGDATFHSGWTLHGAAGNPTPNVREIMTIIYYDAAAHVSEADSENRKADLATWFPGLKVGDLAASPINPVVFP